MTLTQYHFEITPNLFYTNDVQRDGDLCLVSFIWTISEKAYQNLNHDINEAQIL